MQNHIRQMLIINALMCSSYKVEFICLYIKSYIMLILTAHEREWVWASWNQNLPPFFFFFNTHMSCRFQHQRSLEGKAGKPFNLPITLYCIFFLSFGSCDSLFQDIYFKLSFVEKFQHNEIKKKKKTSCISLQCSLITVQTVAWWLCCKNILYFLFWLFLCLFHCHFKTKSVLRYNFARN